MRSTWVRRLERLESILRSRAHPEMVFRYGYLRRLPADSGGQRHVVTTKTEPTALANVEQCEFEERVGPAPGPTEDLSFTVYLSKDEAQDSSPSP